MAENIFSNLKYITVKPSNDKVFQGARKYISNLKCKMCECKMYLKNIYLHLK